MSTLLITTPGMGKTYLVKRMKKDGILALDFDVKGSKPSDEVTWGMVRKSNTLFVNSAFDAGYEYVTAWPNSLDLELLNKDVKIIFVIPVGDAWTGCMLRIAARQPGTPFIDDMMNRYHDLVDSLEGMYLDAVNTHQDVSRVIVTKAHDTLIDVWASINTTGYNGGSFLDVNARFSPESAVRAILPRYCKDFASEIFKECLTPDLVSELTFGIDLGALDHIYTSVHGFGMFSFCHIDEIHDFVPESANVRRIANTCGDYYLITHHTLVESDEMGDWYRAGYIFFKHHSK